MSEQDDLEAHNAELAAREEAEYNRSVEAQINEAYDRDMAARELAALREKLAAWPTVTASHADGKALSEPINVPITQEMVNDLCAKLAAAEAERDRERARYERHAVKLDEADRALAAERSAHEDTRRERERLALRLAGQQQLRERAEAQLATERQARERAEAELKRLQDMYECVYCQQSRTHRSKE